MPKLKPGTIVPSVEEDRAITAAARADADAVPLTDAQWKKAKASARVGRPPKADCKEQIALRVDADVLAVVSRPRDRLANSHECRVARLSGCRDCLTCACKTPLWRGFPFHPPSLALGCMSVIGVPVVSVLPCAAAWRRFCHHVGSF